MNDSKLNLDSIVIESPCKVDWNSMTGDEKSRFCHQCKLNVYNISEMEDKEIIELFERNSDSNASQLCLRMYKRADGTVIRRDCQIRLRQLKKALIRSVASVVGLTAWFSVSQPAMAQTEADPKISTSHKANSAFEKLLNAPSEFSRSVDTSIGCRDGKSQTIYSLGMLLLMGVIFLGAIFATVLAIKKGASYFAIGGILIGTTFILGFMWTVYDSLKVRQVLMGSIVPVDAIPKSDIQ